MYVCMYEHKHTHTDTHTHTHTHTHYTPQRTVQLCEGDGLAYKKYHSQCLKFN